MQKPVRNLYDIKATKGKFTIWLCGYTKEQAEKRVKRLKDWTCKIIKDERR